MSNSPWLSIWCNPREAIRKIVSTNPKRSLWVLAGIYGFSSLLNTFQSVYLGEKLGLIAILALALIIGPIWGYIIFAFWGWLLTLVGKLFKGQGSFAAIRAAYAWSSVPYAVTGVLWIVLILLFGQALFLNFPEVHLLKESQMTLLFSILIAKVVLAIWSLVIFLNALAEVQQFSVLRAIGNVLVACILLGIVMGIFWMLLIPTAGISAGHLQTAFQFIHQSNLLDSLRERL